MVSAISNFCPRPSFYPQKCSNYKIRCQRSPMFHGSASQLPQRRAKAYSSPRISTRYLTALKWSFVSTSTSLFSSTGTNLTCGYMWPWHQSIRYASIFTRMAWRALRLKSTIRVAMGTWDSKSMCTWQTTVWISLMQTFRTTLTRQTTAQAPSGASMR